jgi:hypothetical protein
MVAFASNVEFVGHIVSAMVGSSGEYTVRLHVAGEESEHNLFHAAPKNRTFQLN